MQDSACQQPTDAGVRWVVKDMAVTHADCHRILPALIPGRAPDWHGAVACWQWADRWVRVSLGEEGERRIASLRLPRTRVRLEASGLDEQQWQRLVADFDRRFQRGGG